MSARLPLLAVRFSFLRGLLRDQAKRTKSCWRTNRGHDLESAPLVAGRGITRTAQVYRDRAAAWHDAAPRPSESPIISVAAARWEACRMDRLPAALPHGYTPGQRMPIPATGLGCVCVGKGGVGEKPFEGFAPTGPAPKNPAAQKTAPDQTTDAISHGRPKCRCGKAYGGIPASHEAAVVAPGKSWASTRNSHGFQQCRFRGQRSIVLSVAAL